MRRPIGPPPHRRGTTLRIVLCRRCARPTGTPGAAFCDECRPRRLSDALMTDADWTRQADLDRGPDPGLG